MVHNRLQPGYLPFKSFYILTKFFSQADNIIIELFLWKLVHKLSKGLVAHTMFSVLDSKGSTEILFLNF